MKAITLIAIAATVVVAAATATAATPIQERSWSDPGHHTVCWIDLPRYAGISPSMSHSS
jgi:hypothetical protein